MKRKEIKILDSEGIPARSAAMLVQEASKYKARVLIEQGSKVINAKSLMGVLSLNARGEEPLFLVLSGDDEEQALEGMLRLMRVHFSVPA